MDALRTLYPQVVRTAGNIAYDANGTVVQYDATAVANLEAANAYKYKRELEYPDFRDYIDGIVKGDDAQVQAYIDACLAVKAKYPKGE